MYLPAFAVYPDSIVSDFVIIVKLYYEIRIFLIRDYEIRKVWAMDPPWLIYFRKRENADGDQETEAPNPKKDGGFARLFFLNVSVVC